MLVGVYEIRDFIFIVSVVEEHGKRMVSERPTEHWLKPSERDFGLPLRTLLPNNVKWLPYPQKPYILHENLHGTNYFLFFDSFSYIGLGLV